MKKIGILKEGKIPPDNRVALTPRHCQILKEKGLEIYVQSSPTRCFEDSEYLQAGIPVVDTVDHCDILLGVKEVPIADLIENKIYFFFSHTIKKQAYNRKLLQSILAKRITLIDYETVTNEKEERLIAFGRYAGMVGAHNALYTYGRRTRAFDLPRMKDLKDYAEAKAVYKTIKWPPLKIVLTGKGRVAMGSAQVLKDMGIAEITPQQFLSGKFDSAVFTQLGSSDYIARTDGTPYNRSDFHHHPELYKSIFEPYYQVADIFINGIYWDDRAPAFFTIDEMSASDFGVEVIADVTCDIAPSSSIPSTIRASTIKDPVYGFNPVLRSETEPYQLSSVDIMAIDNLPNEMPRDASNGFGNQFIEHILPEIVDLEHSEMLKRATIATEGHLTENYLYLSDYAQSVS